MRCVPKLGQQGNPDSAGEFCWKGAHVSVCFSCLGVVFLLSYPSKDKMLLFISSSIWALQGTIPQERLRYCNHLWNSLNISPDNGNICPCVRAKVWMQQLGVPRTSTSFRSNTLLRKFFRELRKGAMNPNFDAGARHKEGLEETICREPQTSRCRQVGFWSWMRPPPSGNSWSRWNKPALGAMAHHAHLCLASKMRGKPWETGYCIWCKLNYNI